MIKQILLIVALSISLLNNLHASHTESVGGELLSQNNLFEKMAVYYFLSLDLNIPAKKLHDDVINGEYQERLKEEQEAIKIATFRPFDIKFLYGYSESVLSDLNIKTVDDFDNKKLNILYRLVEHIIETTSCTKSFSDDYCKFYLVNKAIDTMNLLSCEKYDNPLGSDKHDKSNILINRLERGSLYSNADGLIHSKIISLFQEPYYRNVPEVVHAMLNLQDYKVDLIREEAREFISNYYRKNQGNALSDCLGLIQNLHAKGSFRYMARILEATKNLEAETKNIVFDIFFYNLEKNYNNLHEKDLEMLRLFDVEKLNPHSQKKYLKILFYFLKARISDASIEDLALFRRFDENNLGNLLLHIVSHHAVHTSLDKAQAIEELKQLGRYKELAEALLAASDDEYLGQIWEIIDLIQAQEERNEIRDKIISYLSQTSSLDFCQKAISVFANLLERVYLVSALSACLDNNNPDISFHAETEIGNLYESSRNDPQQDKAGIIADIFDRYAKLASTQSYYLPKPQKSPIEKIIDIVLKDNFNADLILRDIRYFGSAYYSYVAIKIQYNHLKSSNHNVRILAINTIHTLLSGEDDKYPTSKYHKDMLIELLRKTYATEENKDVKLIIEEHLKKLNIKINNSWCSIS